MTTEDRGATPQDDGGPAFPMPPSSEYVHPGEDGMSLRDYYAGQALIGMMNKWDTSPNKNIARACYQVADALVAERRRRRESK